MLVGRKLIIVGVVLPFQVTLFPTNPFLWVVIKISGDDLVDTLAPDQDNLLDMTVKHNLLVLLFATAPADAAEHLGALACHRRAERDRPLRIAEGRGRGRSVRDPLADLPQRGRRPAHRTPLATSPPYAIQRRHVDRAVLQNAARAAP